jgi:hypothetical protein
MVAFAWGWDCLAFTNRYAAQRRRTMTISNDEWAQRILCSDGNCIGIIGSDGRCTECGKPYTGDHPLPAIDSETASDSSAAASEDLDQQAVPATNSPAEGAMDDDDASPDDDWDNRTLCIDESCIGVVGPDGRCKECGKPYSG